ncbi:Zinc finger, C2H2-like [Penicillium digitatum]|nr:Zinc finger, C2H2-like [Penicillium digitatum]
MMARPTRNNNSSTILEAAFQWPDGELENWRTEYIKQPETLFMSPSPDPSTTTWTPTARLPSCNFQLQIPSPQFPPTPAALGSMLSPTPSSSPLDPSIMKRSVNNHSLRCVPPRATSIIALSSARLSDTRCPSAWDDLSVLIPTIKETLQVR